MMPVSTGKETGIFFLLRVDYTHNETHNTTAIWRLPVNCAAYQATQLGIQRWSSRLQSISGRQSTPPRLLSTPTPSYSAGMFYCRRWIKAVTALTTPGLWLVMVLTTLSGCTTALITTPNPIQIDHTEYTRVYTASVEVLRDAGFRIDTHSHRFGIVTTYPKAAPTAFEPWHPDQSTPSKNWQSTFNHQRHHAMVTIEPVQSLPPMDTPLQTKTHTQKTVTDYRIRIEVLVERRQTPTLYLTGSTVGHGVFGALTATPDEWRQRGIAGSYWQPLGRDAHLEQRLLAQIIRKSLQIQTDDNPT